MRRSVRIFRLFLHEQDDPAAFYSALAADSVAQAETFTALAGRLVLDVGGGGGYFATAFGSRGARYVGIDLDQHSDLPSASQALRGDGTRLPIRSASVDIAYSSNVVEHVPHPQDLIAELVRVTRPGGLVIVSFTPWLSPWGGHETSPWHYLGGHRARRRYLRTHGREPKNRYGESLFGYRVAEALRWVDEAPGCELVRALPRYHPKFAWWVVRVPGLRELATWNLLLVLRRRG